MEWWYNIARALALRDFLESKHKQNHVTQKTLQGKLQHFVSVAGQRLRSCRRFSLISG